MEGTVAADGPRRGTPHTPPPAAALHAVTRRCPLLTMDNATRQAGKNKPETEDMDSEEDESVQAQAQNRYGENMLRLEMFWIK